MKKLITACTVCLLSFVLISCKKEEAASTNWTKINDLTTLGGTYPGAVLKMHVTGPYLILATAFEGIYHSADGGKTFIKSIGVPANLTVFEFAVSGVGETFAATSEGLYLMSGMSVNGGPASWSPVGPSRTQIESIDITGNIVWALRAGDLWVFDIGNQGAGWTRVQNISGAKLVRKPAAPGAPYVVDYNGSVRQSIDGNTWNFQQFPGLPQNTTIRDVGIIGAQVVVSTTRDEIYYINTNGGSVWSKATINSNNPVLQPGQFHNSLTKEIGFATSAQSGILKTTDNGRTWNTDNEGLLAPYVFSVITSQNVAYAACVDGFYSRRL